MKNNILIIGGILGMILFAGIVNGAVFTQYSSASYVTQQTYRPDFQTYYSASELSTYWPALNDEDTCLGRQDILLSVSPAGCQPAVVRSDLLAEQNVPVFCQIDALTINPLVNIKEINNIVFTGDYPKEVIGSGFHPARAALNTGDTLLGDPLINNVGYVVLVLKKNPIEKDLPNSVNVTLSARIKYDSGNALGVGQAEYILNEVSDEQWETERYKQSFWQGRYFVRLEEVNENGATVSIYSGDKKLTTTIVKQGEISKEIYVPGSYCRAGIQIAFDGFEKSQKSARIEFGSQNSPDSIEVVEGSRFMNQQCRVTQINIDKLSYTGEKTGNVTLRCGNKQIILMLQPRYTDMFFDVFGSAVQPFREDGEIKVDFRGQAGIYSINSGNQLIHNGMVGVDAIYGDMGKDVGRLVWPNMNKKFVSDALKLKEYKDWLIKLNAALVQYKEKGADSQIVLERVWGEPIESNFSRAIAEYEKVAKEHPLDKMGTAENSPSYGEEALYKAIEMAGRFGKDYTKARLIQSFIDTYPKSERVLLLKEELKKARGLDTSFAQTSVEIGKQYQSLRLVELEEPSDKAKAEFTMPGVSGKFEIALGEEVSFAEYTNLNTQKVRLNRIIDSENVEVVAFCKSNSITGSKIGSYETKVVRLAGQVVEICKSDRIKLESVDVKTSAKVRLLPKVKGTETETNLTVQIGIEKRAIQLGPDKTKEMIKNLNESIERWDKISKTLANVVSGMKGACFATSAILTFKNFLSGLTGESIARQEVMRGENGWTAKCNDMIARGENGYTTPNQCYMGESENIKADVEARTRAIEKVNGVLSRIEEPLSKGGGLFEDKTINTEEAKKQLASVVRSECGNLQVQLSGGRNWVDEKGKTSVSVSEVLDEKNLEEMSYSEVRNIYTNCILGRDKVSETGKAKINGALAESVDRISSNIIMSRQAEENKKKAAQGVPVAFIARPSGQNRILTEVVSANNLNVNIGTIQSSYVSTVIVPGSSNAQTGASFDSGEYLLGLEKTDSGTYVVREVFKYSDGKYNALAGDGKVSQFQSTYGIGEISSIKSTSYSNKFLNAKAKYFETEPYKGMPAVVPFDLQQGWYAATRQTLPSFGGIGAFDSSGRVVSFWMCNVGENGREQFEEGIGDDICQQINLNTGQPLRFFPGLDESSAEKLIDRGVKALNDAAKQYGSGIRYITIEGQRIDVGPPSTGTPGTQCQDFMSPEDCHLMFNVCDPVICPSSRCDFGGAYPVADVIQTGIVGSALLCLPNVKEGIYVPVCLSGIQAGIDSYISVLKAHRDCLQTSLDSGQLVGLCDQLHSIYLCEFFWRQAAPVANVLLPNVIEYALTGRQGTRGGGEYLSVQGAWNNMRKSVDYFTQSYAVNSLKVFEAKSIEEAGGEFCRSFASSKSPTSFKSLIEPDSPPQFYGWFSSTKFTDATVPATSQYKVFYHIFAGKDSGVYYSVYVKNPPGTSYYATTPNVQVASGFIAGGQYKSETKDFTAPEGYSELCIRVNDQEECGFKQVGTEFAINYARDLVVNSTLSQSGITSENNCVSGTPSVNGVLGSVITNTNPGAVLDESVNPEIYKRGIVRICSTQNPGSSTEPLRFVDVGYCSDTKIRCWLDKKSVDNAITDNNVGLKESTIEDLENRQNEQMAKDMGFYSRGDGDAELDSIDSAVQKLEGTSKEINNNAQPILERISFIENSFYLNDQKARTGSLKGYIYQKISEKLLAEKKIELNVTSEVSGLIDDIYSTGTQSQERILSLSESYDPLKKIDLLLNGKSTGVYVQGNKVMLSRWFLDKQIGTVSDGVIFLLPDVREDIPDIYDLLEGSSINGANIITTGGGVIPTTETKITFLNLNIKENRIYFYDGQEDTEIYVNISTGKVMKKSSDSIYKDSEVGTFNNNVVKITSLNILQNAGSGKYYDSLHGGVVYEGSLILFYVDSNTGNIMSDKSQLWYSVVIDKNGNGRIDATGDTGELIENIGTISKNVIRMDTTTAGKITSEYLDVIYYPTYQPLFNNAVIQVNLVTGVKKIVPQRGFESAPPVTPQQGKGEPYSNTDYLILVDVFSIGNSNVKEVRAVTYNSDDSISSESQTGLFIYGNNIYYFSNEDRENDFVKRALTDIQQTAPIYKKGSISSSIIKLDDSLRFIATDFSDEGLTLSAGLFEALNGAKIDGKNIIPSKLIGQETYLKYSLELVSTVSTGEYIYSIKKDGVPTGLFVHDNYLEGYGKIYYFSPSEEGGIISEKRLSELVKSAEPFNGIYGYASRENLIFILDKDVVGKGLSQSIYNELNGAYVKGGRIIPPTFTTMKFVQFVKNNETNWINERIDDYVEPDPDATYLLENEMPKTLPIRVYYYGTSNEQHLCAFNFFLEKGFERYYMKKNKYDGEWTLVHLVNRQGIKLDISDTTANKLNYNIFVKMKEKCQYVDILPVDSLNIVHYPGVSYTCTFEKLTFPGNSNLRSIVGDYRIIGTDLSAKNQWRLEKFENGNWERLDGKFLYGGLDDKTNEMSALREEFARKCVNNVEGSNQEIVNLVKSADLKSFKFVVDNGKTVTETSMVFSFDGSKWVVDGTPADDRFSTIFKSLSGKGFVDGVHTLMYFSKEYTSGGILFIPGADAEIDITGKKEGKLIVYDDGDGNSRNERIFVYTVSGNEHWYWWDSLDKKWKYWYNEEYVTIQPGSTGAFKNHAVLSGADEKYGAVLMILSLNE